MKTLPAPGVLREILDDSFAFASPRGTVTRWGAGAAALFGTPPEELAGRSLFDVVLGSSDGGWRALLEGESDSAQRAVEANLRRGDGREFPCDVRFFPVALADGLDFSSFASDLNDEHPPEKREAWLRKRHTRVIELLEQADASDGDVDLDGQLAGILVTFHSTSQDPVTPVERLEDAVERTERTERETEGLAGKLEQALREIEDLRGRLEPLELRPSAPDDLEELRAGVAEAATAALDAQRQAADAQREARTTRRALVALRPAAGAVHPNGEEPDEPTRPDRPGFDDAVVPMATLTLEGDFMELNLGFRDLVGYSEAEFASVHWPSNVDRARVEEHERLRQALAAGELEGTHLDLTYMHKEGLMVELGGRMSLVPAQNGSPDHLLLTIDVR